MNTNDRFLGYCPYQIDEMLQHTWEKCEGVGTEIVYIYLATCTPESAWVYRD